MMRFAETVMHVEFQKLLDQECAGAICSEMMTYIFTLV
jgi:hypothetical protein